MKENEEAGGRDTGEESHIQELPEEEIARLKGDLEAKRKEAEENYNKYLRACADIENLKKRLEKEKADCVAYANEGFISELLPVIDNFERALAHANGGEETMESLRSGVRLILDQMSSAVKKFGLEEVKSMGEKFNPSVHHAISEEEAEGAGPGTIVREFQKGYFLKGKLIRPAMVAVAKTKTPA